MKTKILFLAPYPHGESPSQRFRFEQYLDLLKENGYDFELHSFLTPTTWKIFFRPGAPFRKALALLDGFIRRFRLITRVRNFDYVFVHREITPVGPPLFEWIISRILKKKLIYDFDDSIWLTDRKSEGPLLKLSKWRQKVSSICHWSFKVSCGNQYLCSFARKFNQNVILIPTTIDTETLHNPEKFKKKPHENIIVGWTGSHSTLKYLVQINKVLEFLEKKYPEMTVWVIADKMPDLSLPRLEFRKWSLETELEDLAQFDIGVMPLPDDEWSKGKCGFKALQYLAMEIPAVVSPVGVNSEIVQHGHNGYLASTDEEWLDCLTALIEDKDRRHKMGTSGRRRVEENYSVRSNSASFLALFEKS